MRERTKIIVVALSTVLTVVLLIGALLGQEQGSSEPYKPLAVLSEVLSRVQTDYVEEPNFTKVTDGALHGMLESLDSYSSYLTPEQYKEYQKAPRGNASIGAVVSKRFGSAIIVSVLPGGPAAQAGLQAFDSIELIDNSSTRDMSYAEVLSHLDGAPGSTVNISVVRPRAAQDPEPIAIPLKREISRPPDVEARIADPGIGYLRVSELPQGEAEQIASKIRDLRKAGATKFVLDLRDDAAGDMQEGVATANLFIRRGLLGYLMGQQYPRQSFTAEEKKAMAEEPLVVLVNDSTGGAAEVAAAAIQDNHRGQLVGVPTFGIGTIQKTIPMDDGSALILSVAKYFSPAGKEIQENGIAPDVVVRQEHDYVSLQERTQPSAPRQDLPLQRAIDLLKTSSAAKPA